MTETTFINELGLMVAAATLFAFLARFIRMPSIVAYLLAGLLLGPATGWVSLSPSLELISDIGIALLLFLVGLELSLDKIRSAGRVSVVAGMGQVVFTAAGGMLLCRLLAFTWMEALFTAFGLTFSSSVLAVKLLDEKRELDTTYGHIAVGCSLVQSFLVIIILSILSGLGPAAGGVGGSPIWGLVQTFGGLVVLVGLVAAASRYVLGRLFAWAANSPDTLVIWSLSWCFGLIMAARTMGLSLEIGAFLAGISLAQLPYNADLHRRVHPMMNFFLAVFFVTLGTRMDLGGLRGGWVAPLVLAAFVLIGNPFIYTLMIPRFGYSARTAVLTGITSAQISEFSFILAGTGVAAGYLQPGMGSLMAFIGLITMSVSAYMIRYNHAIHHCLQRSGLLKIFERGALEDEQGTAGTLDDHIIVVGMNSLGLRLVEALGQRGETVLAIDTDPKKLAKAKGHQLLGNASYTALMDQAGLSKAKLLISALRVDATNDILAYRCRQAGVRCAVHVHDIREMDNLLEIGANYLMLPKVDGIKLQTARIKKEGLLTKP